MIFNNFGFSHGQISKFWNGKKLLPSIWNYCLHLDEVKKRWILINFWTGMIYGKFMIFFPRQITAEQMGFSFEFLVTRIIFALGRTFQNLEKKTPKSTSQAYPQISRTKFSI